MNHLQDIDLIAHYYGEPLLADNAQHLAICPICQDAFTALRKDLDRFDALEAPARGDDYGTVVWQAIAPRLQERITTKGWRWPSTPLRYLAAVAVLALAFWIGRQSTQSHDPPDTALQPGSERLALAMIRQHLDDTRLVFTDLSHGASDTQIEQDNVRQLVSDTRIYRAALPGDRIQLHQLLDDLELILLELAHRQDPHLDEDLQSHVRDLLFKIRATQQHIQNEAQTASTARTLL